MEIEETVKGFIVSQLMIGKRGDHLDTHYSLIENGVLDSLGIIRLIQFIEDRFFLSIEDEDIVPENFENMECISQFIRRLVSDKP